MRKSEISIAGWIVLGTATVVALLAFLADRANVPVIAPYMDLIAERIYRWLPYLSRFPGIDSMWISSSIVWLGVLLVLLPVAIVFPFSYAGRMESQLRQRHRKQKEMKSR